MIDVIFAGLVNLRRITGVFAYGALPEKNDIACVKYVTDSGNRRQERAQRPRCAVPAAVIPRGIRRGSGCPTTSCSSVVSLDPIATRS